MHGLRSWPFPGCPFTVTSTSQAFDIVQVVHDGASRAYPPVLWFLHVYGRGFWGPYDLVVRAATQFGLCVFHRHRLLLLLQLTFGHSLIFRLFHRVRASLALAHSHAHRAQPPQAFEDASIKLGVLIAQALEAKGFPARHVLAGVGAPGHHPYRLGLPALVAGRFHCEPVTPTAQRAGVGRSSRSVQAGRSSEDVGSV